MDKHTFIGKRKVGSTDVCDFTDYQGIGRDPLYKRYDSVNSIIRRVISPQYIHFLAIPDYSDQDDAVNWYIDEWNDTPEVLSSLDGVKREHYQLIKDKTLAHFRKVLNDLSGEELQVMACALRYIDDDFIFCCDDKVFVVAWGMTPDTRKHFSKGELVHESPTITKFQLTFQAGEHGSFRTKSSRTITLREGTEVTANDVPEVIPAEGFRFAGWNPNPFGVVVNSDMTFTAQYEGAPIVPPVIPPVDPPEPEMVTCRFDAGANGSLRGNPEFTMPRGSHFIPANIPPVVPNKGYEFRGWDINPLQTILNQDVTFHAVYEQKVPWYKKIFGPGCLKWLLWIVLALLLLWLIWWIFPKCTGTREVNGVIEQEQIIDVDGDTIDNNGWVAPIDMVDGQLPDDSYIVAPVRGEDGILPPIVREEGVPAIMGDRLILFLENENDNVDALADDFKKAYPGNQYSIIGFDREVKSLVIQIPPAERDEIRRTINAKIPNHQFIVFDEEIYEITGRLSSSPTSAPGWHLKAVKAPQGWEITKGSPSVVVAVVDDGIEASHPMFKGRIVDAYNVFTQDNKLSRGDGHGTHVAGLAVGSLDFLNQGAAGIAPDCKLMPVQVMDNGMCPLSALVAGVMYSVHKGADVINISIGPSLKGLDALPVPIQEEIARTQFKNVEKLWNRVCSIAVRKNSILVFAAGNDNIISSIPPENRSKVCITVGSVDQKLYPTDFTNYGPNTDISAPGTDIYSAMPGKRFEFQDGTSMSAPIVSGAVALMKSLKKDLTVEQARNVLYRTGCDVFGAMPPMVQVNLALDAVKRGDFSKPEFRQMPSVPEDDVIGGTAPEAWVTDPTPPIFIVGPGGNEVAPTDGGVIVPIDGGGSTTPVAGAGPADGGAVAPTPPPANETDYEAIRRMIAEYKKKIAELESKLPENKK